MDFGSLSTIEASYLRALALRLNTSGDYDLIKQLQESPRDVQRTAIKVYAAWLNESGSCIEAWPLTKRLRVLFDFCARLSPATRPITQSTMHRLRRYHQDRTFGLPADELKRKDLAISENVFAERRRLCKPRPPSWPNVANWQLKRS
jgi:hypothetical protein